MEAYSKDFNIPLKLERHTTVLLYDGSTSVKADTTSSSVAANSGSLDGYKNPHWKSQIRSHTQAGTNMDASSVRWDWRPFSMQEITSYTAKPGHTIPPWYGVDVLTSGQQYYFSILPKTHLGINGSLLAEANNTALTRFVSDANSSRRQWLSGETIGDWAQLVRQIRKPGHGLIKGLNSYIAAVKKRAARAHAIGGSAALTRMLSDTWLEYSFGWRPLISDLDNIVDYYNEKQESSRYDVRKIQGVGRSEDSFWEENDSSKPIITHTNLAGHYAKARRRVKQRLVVKYSGELNMNTSAAGYVAEKIGFDPSSWLPTAWELIPYSFLVDYFTNFGNIISSLSFPRSQVRWMMKTVIQDSESEFVDPEYHFLRPPSGDTAEATYTNVQRVNSRIGVKCTSHVVARERYNGTLVPDVTFSLPHSGKQWLSLAALFAGGRGAQRLLRKLDRR